MEYPRDIEPISKQLTIIIGLTVVGFLAFDLALSFYRNVLFDETLKEMQLKNAQIAKDIEKNYRDLDYYRSDQFKDKYAKENLNKIAAGEKVLIITQSPKPTAPVTATGSLQSEREAKFREFVYQMPVSEQWWMYLFHREVLEEIKQSL